MNSRVYLAELYRELIDEGIRGSDLKTSAIERMLAEMVLLMRDHKSCNCKPKTLTTKSK